MSDCVHFWELTPPGELESDAVCRFCGEKRVFSNVEVNEGKPSWRYGPQLAKRRARKMKKERFLWEETHRA